MLRSPPKTAVANTHNGGMFLGDAPGVDFAARNHAQSHEKRVRAVVKKKSMFTNDYFDQEESEKNMQSYSATVRIQEKLAAMRREVKHPGELDLYIQRSNKYDHVFFLVCAICSVYPLFMNHLGTFIRLKRARQKNINAELEAEMRGGLSKINIVQKNIDDLKQLSPRKMVSLLHMPPMRHSCCKCCTHFVGNSLNRTHTHTHNGIE
jgi:hypothetical protein